MAQRFQSLIKPYAINMIKMFNTVKHAFSYNRKYFLKGKPENAAQIAEYNTVRPFGPQEYFCYAPFKSLYFGANGEVISCCYNRKYVLGTYPENSVKDIWLSGKLKKLRTAMVNNDLSLGCTACKDQFDDKNYDAILSINYDKVPLNKDYPTLMEFELSNTCNLGCVMCDERFSTFIAAKKNLPIKKMLYDEAFAHQLDEFIPHLKEAKFLGGEPFLIPLYSIIWEKIIQLNPDCRIIVQTNGTVLTDTAKQLMEQGNFHFNISIDSFRKETYESIRVNASFEKTIDNFNYILDYCKKRNHYFGIASCPIQQNWNEIPEIVRKGNELDVTVYLNRVWTPAECALWGWDSANLLHVYNTLKQETFTATTDIQKKNVLHYNEFISQIYAWYLESKKNENA